VSFGSISGGTRWALARNMEFHDLAASVVHVSGVRCNRRLVIANRTHPQDGFPARDGLDREGRRQSRRLTRIPRGSRQGRGGLRSGWRGHQSLMRRHLPAFRQSGHSSTSPALIAPVRHGPALAAKTGLHGEQIRSIRGITSGGSHLHEGASASIHAPGLPRQRRPPEPGSRERHRRTIPQRGDLAPPERSQRVLGSGHATTATQPFTRRLASSDSQHTVLKGHIASRSPAHSIANVPHLSRVSCGFFFRNGRSSRSEAINLVQTGGRQT
jgi:hypothetical protein